MYYWVSLQTKPNTIWECVINAALELEQKELWLIYSLKKTKQKNNGLAQEISIETRNV